MVFCKKYFQYQKRGSVPKKGENHTCFKFSENWYPEQFKVAELKNYNGFCKNVFQYQKRGSVLKMAKNVTSSKYHENWIKLNFTNFVSIKDT